MIYTSYFYNIKNIPQGYTLVSIERKNPKGFDLPQCKLLAPSEELSNALAEGLITDSDFIAGYKLQLKLLPKETKLKLMRHFEPYAQSQQKNLVLVANGPKGMLSHRHILAQMYAPVLTIKEL